MRMLVAILVMAAGVALGQTNAIVPTMTASNAPSPFIVSVTNVAEDSIQPAWKMFDNDASTYAFLYGVNQVDDAIIIYMGASKKPVSLYRVFCRNGYDSYFPRAWALEGSVNGSSWTLIDAQNSFSNTLVYELGAWVQASPVYTVSSEKVANYDYVRFRCVTNGSAYTDRWYVPELFLWEVVQPLPAIAVLGSSASSGASILAGGESGVKVLQ